MKKLLYLFAFIPSFLFADQKVSTLNEMTTPKTTDYMYIVANSTSMKVQVGSLLDLPGASTSYLSVSSAAATYLYASSATANYQILDADLTDLADGSLTGSKVGDGVPAANIAAGTIPADVMASSVAAVGFYSNDAVRTALGLAIGTNVQAYDADLDDLADGSLTGSKVGDGVPAANIAAGTIGSDVMASSVTIGTFYNNATVRTNLGLAIGTDVQAYDADLDDLADGSLTGTKVGFADTDSNFTATNVQAAIEELDDTNGSGVNAADGKVNWTQLISVPAGFADGTDDGGAGGADNLGTHVATKTITAGFGISGTTITLTSSITANAFFGDGSNLTNVPQKFVWRVNILAPDAIPTANGAVVTNASGTGAVLFDASTAESLTYNTILYPYRGGALTAKVDYSMVSATANEVEWHISIECITPGDTADIDTDSFGTVDSLVDTVPGTAGYLDTVSDTSLNGDSCAEGDRIRIKVTTDATDATNDDATGDRELRGLTIYEP